MENEQKEIKSEILIDDGFYLTHEDRMLISDIVKENLETTKSSGLPFF